MDKNLYTLLPFGRTLAVLTKSYYGALTNRLAHLDIDRHYSILILIESMDGGCTQHYLCEQLKIDKVSMVRMIQYLIEKKYIHKVVNPHDKREHLLQLSKKANKVLPQIHQAIREMNEATFATLSTQKQQALCQMLTTIQTNLDELPTDRIYINYKKLKKNNEA